MSFRAQSAAFNPLGIGLVTQNVSASQKKQAVVAFAERVKLCVLTTRTSSGSLNSRMMESMVETKGNLRFRFLSNKATEKFDDIANDPHVNITYFEANTMNWATVQGTATLINDQAFVSAHWTAAKAAFLTNVGDSVHTGDASDPRIGVIEVTPTEIKYLTSDFTTEEGIEAAAAKHGNFAAPGAPGPGPMLAQVHILTGAELGN